MRLGIDATSTFSGGALVHLNQLLENSSKSDFEKIFVWTNSSKLNNFLKCKNISIIKVDKKNLLKRFFWQRYTLTKELKKNQCDVLLCNSGYSFSKFNNRVLIIQNYIPFKFKFIFQFFPKLKFFKFLFLRFVLKNEMKISKGIIFLNKYIKDDIKKRFVINSKCKIKTIEHSLDTIPIELKKNRIKNKSAWNIIYPSYIDIYKNHINLIKAINNLNNKFKLKVTFLGEADLNYFYKLKKYIKKKRLTKLFQFKKYINSRKDYYFFLNNFNIAIFLSNCENYPKTLIEIMNLKIPLICSNETPMKQITKNYSLLCDQKNVKSIEKKIIYCIRNYRKIHTYVSKKTTYKNDESMMSKKTYNFLSSFVWKK